MVDYSIKGCGRRCAKTDREIGPGDSYFSMVTLNEDGELIREDFCQEAWEGPVENCVGWWSSEIPNPNDGRVYWAPNEVLLAYFDELLAGESRPETTYVMAILMIRRRLLKHIETRCDQSGTEFLILGSNRFKGELQVPVQMLDENQINNIQNELGEHLFTNKLADDSRADESEVAESE